MTTGSQTPADYVVQFGIVKGSSLLEESDTGFKASVLYSVEGIGEVGARGEVDPTAEVFSSLGVVGRPLAPSMSGSRSVHAEVMCLRTADGLVPMSARDLRLRMGGDGPNEGTIALVGYGGGFHSLSPADGDPDNGTIHILYCPYDFSNGVAQKAHVVVLDPTSGNENISIVHSEGHSIVLLPDGTTQIRSPDGQSYLQVKDGEVAIGAGKITLNGSVFIGNPVTGVPLLAGPASPPCPRLFLSPA